MKPAKLLITVGIVLIPSLGIARDEPAPDMEMLEFLGSFETARGKPVDPLGFVDSSAKENKNGLQDAVKKDRKRNRKPEKPEQKGHDDEK